MTLTEIRAALDSRGLRPLKQLGQNFLHDQNLARWLAEHAVEGLEAGATVVEIGPGLGALTSVLLAKNLRLIALEKDRGLCVFLREHFAAEIAAGKPRFAGGRRAGNAAAARSDARRRSAAICPITFQRRC